MVLIDRSGYGDPFSLNKHCEKLVKVCKNLQFLRTMAIALADG
ncbi:MAG: hypothetical protein AAGA60_06620 [Cyanobacteria bacterium P01_E01_bin.42]